MLAVNAAPPASPVRGTWGPLALMLSTPILAIGAWATVLHHDGSILDALERPRLADFPLPSLTAALVVVGWVVFQYLLLRWLPGKEHLGPTTPAGDRPRYRLNGVLAWFVTHGLLLGAWAAGLPVAHLYDHYGEVLATLTPAALVVCALLYWRGLHAPSCKDVTRTGNVAFDFFQGIELHPRLGGVALKQLVNCRVSMMGWSATTVCFALKHLELTGSVGVATWVSVGLQVAYLFKFFVWEAGYFGSLDIMHDRFGYYICWGVLAWVPAVYALVALFLVEGDPGMTPVQGIAVGLIGVVSLAVNYDADRQRVVFRERGGAMTIWGKPAQAIKAPYTTFDGERRQNLLLISGWWGLARHFHYVPEITLAIAWTLPAGFNYALPWFYVVFLTILLFDRAERDDLRCANKYSRAWDQYRAIVKYKVIPGIW